MGLRREYSTERAGEYRLIGQVDEIMLRLLAKDDDRGTAPKSAVTVSPSAAQTSAREMCVPQCASPHHADSDPTGKPAPLAADSGGNGAFVSLNSFALPGDNASCA